jgi:hypothetical protein
MVRPDLENIPDLPLPPGLEVRPVQPSKRDHPGSRPGSIPGSLGFSAETDRRLKSGWDPNFDPTLWRVAWEG